ncbi:MAG: hypothetical protein AAF789_12850, partial [Bacteroidota bacterium]
MNKLTISILAALAIAQNFTAFAQDGWNWGTEVDKAKENNVIYTDAMKAGKYEEARGPLEWLLTNTPDLNPSIYIKGVELYEELAKKETDPVIKDQLLQKAIKLHDDRVTYFPKSKGSVMDRKALFAYRYYSKNKKKYPYLFQLYEENFKLNGAKMNSG